MVEQGHVASNILLILADVGGILMSAGKVLTSRAGTAVKALHEAGINCTAIARGRN
jgi:3-deoxy-D-manno-octulosonate 8-phosphate phosphatase KdsC-like HAD superfamily phosphatase